MTPQVTSRPLHPTRPARDMMSFIGISDQDIQLRIADSGLLIDPSAYAARRLAFDSISFVAFRNGAESIRLFLSSEWLNDLEVMRADFISWHEARKEG